MLDKWDGSQMPSQRGKRVVVTGANQGLGFVIAQRLALRGAHVVLACRSESRGREAVATIRAALLADESAEKGGEVELMLVDVGCMEDVKRFAAELHAKFDRIDLLVNNAGVGVPPQEFCTDGYTIQFGVNYLGHFFLTTLVMDLLRASPEARIINVSSVAHRQHMTRAMLFFDTTVDVDQLPYGKGDFGVSRYEKSKLCSMLFGLELDRRLRAAGITNVRSVVAHPGVCHTKIFEDTTDGIYLSCFSSIISLYYRLFFQSAEMGALPILYAATMDDAQGGQYYGPDGGNGRYGYPTLEQPCETAHNKLLAQQLWAKSEQLTKTKFDL